MADAEFSWSLGTEPAESARLGPALPEPQSLLAGLNPAQLQAVTHGDGPLLILAGAGSGKTRAITRRIAWLVASGRAQLDEVCAITFTNRAAGEMRARVEALLPSRRSWISTFHSLCVRLLRRDIEALEFPGGQRFTRDFSIYDTGDRLGVLKRILGELSFGSERLRPAQVGAWISGLKQRAADEREPTGETGLGGLEDEVLAVAAERYQATLRAANALDFDDLLLLTLRLFDEHPGIRDSWAWRFRHVLVDEYQDTNRVQYRLTRHLCSAHGNLVVCGDPDQSIYAWRGADIGNILDFERDFPGARTIVLDQNYRSTQAILDAAQAVIEHNLERKPKALWTEGERGEAPRVVECGDEDDEANHIARRIRELTGEGYRYADVAIFYRANFQQRALERGLRLAGVPYRIAGGVEFYQRQEIKDLISYLKLIANPADDVACERVLNVPPRGIGDRSLEVLREWATDRRVPLSRAAGSGEARAQIRGRARVGLEAFAQLLEQLRDFAKRPAGEALGAVLESTDYLDFLRGAVDPAVEMRVENVLELQANAETYDLEFPEGGLRGFLEEVALVSDVDGLGEAETEAGQEQGAVTLMTLHSAKGLEFPVVFVSGMEEDLLPHVRALEDPSGRGLEEERRLVYVGLTRAQRRLFLTHARARMQFGQTGWRQPSRFLAELGDTVAAPAAVEEPDVLGDYEAAEHAAALSEGDWVAHAQFGRGQVEHLRGSGVNARATVRFAGAGTKVLLLQYAKLERLGGRT
jgi:DNA helicase-2/ATP-dependent DNA helicase PcrA